MSGDFLAFQIHLDPRYYSITGDVLLTGPKITEQNMWRFPNLLGPIGLEAKIYPVNRNWEVTTESMSILDQIYGDKNIILPTHWYRDIVPANTNGLVDRGLRLYTDNLKTLKISYALWWIKSHVIANEIWPHRLEEIEELKKSNHPNKHLLPQVIDNYHNWKWMSMRYDILNNGEFDLRYYAQRYFYKIYMGVNKTSYKQGYSFYDIDKIFYSNEDHLDLLERDLEISIQRNYVRDYTQANLQKIEDCLKLKVSDPEFDNNQLFFDAIVNYAKDIINERTYQFDYYNRTSN